MSLKEPVWCIWRRVDAGNWWKVRYEGGMAEVSVLLCLRVSICPGMVTETRNEFKPTHFVHLEVGWCRESMKSQVWGGMAESVGGLGFLCICRAGKRHGNMKRVQMNSLHAFWGRLMQGINGKSGMRYGWECQWPWVFVYPYAQEWLLKDKTSLKGLVSWIGRWVDAGNQWKVGYEGGMAEVSVPLCLRVSICPGMVTERQNLWMWASALHGMYESFLWTLNNLLQSVSVNSPSWG